MRIISGKAKGLHLKSPFAKSKAIRPTSDRCREALFSILGERVNGAKVLDLFAGTGAFGLEALSRGAISAVFVDNSAASLSIIKKNIILLRSCIGPESAEFDISVLKSDLRKGISAAIRSSPSKSFYFDIIFLDPPYDKGLAQHLLNHLDGGSILRDNGIVIAEERTKVDLPSEFAHLNLTDRRTYGDTSFWLYTL